MHAWQHCYACRNGLAHPAVAAALDKALLLLLLLLLLPLQT
jgi:hypothetical protein